MNSAIKPVIVTVVFMGDSVTFGQHVDPSVRWMGLIDDRLTRRYLPTAINLRFLNSGVSGETTRQGLERFPRDVQNHYPEVLALQFGFNDCNCWVTDRGLPRVSEAAYRENLIEMIARARCFEVQQIILSTHYPTMREKLLPCGESLEVRRRRYDQIVREVAKSEAVTLCDIETAFPRVTDPELSQLLLPYPDQLHLSPKGHRRYADQILPFVTLAIEGVVRNGGGML
jgi:acyl-CoA thioesterase-1